MELLARDTECTAHRFVFTNAVGIREEQLANRVPTKSLLHVLDHPTTLRVSLLSIGWFFRANEGPVDSIEIEECSAIRGTRE